MRVKVQTMLKAYLVVGMFFSSTNASASYWLECIGLVTIKSDLAELTTSFEEKKFIKASVYIHEHTFTCKGYDSKINKKGIINYQKIDLSPSINEFLLKKGAHLQVNYIYGEPRLSGPYSEWTALKTVETIPLKKITKNHLPKSPSKESERIQAERINEEMRIQEEGRIKTEAERMKELKGPTEYDRLNSADAVDTDGDGVSNRYDVCLTVKNPDQADRDNDRVGDACDSCPEDPAPFYENGCPMGIELKK